MKLPQKVDIGFRVLYAKLLRIKTPIFLSWYLTNRCNLKCKYCDVYNIQNKELGTDVIFRILDELAELGCKYIIFSGGEPLLRQDIGRIIDYASGKGIYTGINSNGILVKKRINELKNLDILQLSFDGPKEVHDKQRGKGSYDAVMDAVKAARQMGIEVAFNVTVTKYNVGEIKQIVDFIKKEKISAHFQPVVPLPFGNSNFNSLKIPAPEYRKLINFLLEEKKKCRFIANTSAGLEYYKKQKKEVIDCGAGRVSCLISSDGQLYPCAFLEARVKGIHCGGTDFKSSFRKLKPVQCNSCLCNKTLDLSKAFSFNLQSILELIRTV